MSRLRELREERNLKQEEVAVMLGTSTPNYNKKENGDVKVSLSEAKKFADFYHLTIEEIFFKQEFQKTILQ